MTTHFCRITSQSCERHKSGEERIETATSESGRCVVIFLQFSRRKLDAENDSTLQELLLPPANVEHFSDMFKTVLMSCVTVLERQY